MRNEHRYSFAALVCCLFVSGNVWAQVSPDAYVPCQEMPTLIGHFNADYRALVRFYNTSFYGNRGGGGNVEGGSPEKRQRLDDICHEYLKRLDAVDFSSLPNQLKTLRDRLKGDSSLDMESIYEAGLVIGDLKRAISNINDFYTGYDPLYTWWMPKVYKELDDALTSYAEAFKSKTNRFAAADSSGIAGHPAGREEILRELKYEMIPYTPEELIDK
jgi:hypothetical protein